MLSILLETFHRQQEHIYTTVLTSKFAEKTGKVEC